MDCSPPDSSVQGSPGKNTGTGSYFLLQWALPDPGIAPVSPALAGGFFTTEPPGSPCIYITKIITCYTLRKATCENRLDKR